MSQEEGFKIEEGIAQNVNKTDEFMILDSLKLSPDNEEKDLETDEVKPAGEEPVVPASEVSKEDGEGAATETKPVTDYKSVIQKLSEKGYLPTLTDMDIEVEEGIVKPFSEIDITDEEAFYDFIGSLIEQRVAEATENKVDASSISDFGKKLLEIEKIGGSVVDVVKQYEQNQRPLEQIDRNTLDGKKEIMKLYYERMLRELPADKPELAEMVRKSYLEEGKVDEEAFSAKADSYYDKMVKEDEKWLESYKKDLAEKQKIAAEARKTYKKNLKESVSNTYKMADDYMLKLVDFATEIKDKKVGSTALTDAFKEMINDPQKAVDLAFFLFNKEEYLKHQTSKKLNEQTRKVHKLVKSTDKNRTGSQVADQESSADDLIINDMIINY